MKKILALLLAAFGFSNAANAAIITVDYQAMNSGYASLSGSFTGDDTNNDGWLVFSELTDWFTNYGGGAAFAALNDLGDFNYLANEWNPNAYQSNQTSQDAYMTWNDWTRSASTSNFEWAFATTVNVDGSASAPEPSTLATVPEPSTLALMLFGLTGIGLSRKKKAA